MKVVFLVHQFYPEFQAGTEKFVFNMAYMAQKNGNKVKVITYSLGDVSSFPYRSGGILYKEFHYQGIPVLAWRYEKEPADLHYLIDPNVDLNFADEILRQEKPDLIHAGHLMRVYPFILAARQLSIPYILTITDFHLICPKIILAPTYNTLCSGPDGGKSCAALCNELPISFIEDRLNVTTKFIRDASAIVAPSQFVAGIFEHEIDGIKVQIIHHGIRQNNLHALGRIYKAEDPVRFGFIGNLAIHKGVHVLISAFKELNVKQASLSIYGSGEKVFVDKLQELAGDNRISFKGSFAAENLGEVLDQIDVLVAPSVCYETYSFVVHEALASMIPVITSNLGGMAEQIEFGVNGFTFQAGDYHDLNNQMKKVIEDPTLLNKMKENIRTRTFVPKIEQEAYVYNRLYQSIV